MQFSTMCIFLFILLISVLINGDKKFIKSDIKINGQTIARSRRFINKNTVVNLLRKMLHTPAEPEENDIQEELCTDEIFPIEGKFNPEYNNELIIKIQENGKCKVIRLTKATHHLANEHLPVWITLKEPSSEFHLLHDVMKNIGKFTMYRDEKTKSAVVYFHKIDQLDGVINNQLYIRKLPGSKLSQVHEVNDKYIFLQGHPFYPSDIDIIPNDKGSRFRRSFKSEKSFKTSEEMQQDIYPELLIAISYDTHIAIEKHSVLPFAVSTVSHVLVVFNAVDMLYESVKSAKIMLNIAGIVIETFENQWGFESSLAIGEVIADNKRIKYILDAENITTVISNYFRQREEYFPRDSYDFIIYNTRNQLIYKSTNVMGIAWESGYFYMYPAGHHYDRINLAIQDHESYSHFAILAHEIAHMMNVDHDSINDIEKHGKYRDSIMLCYNRQCAHGSTWSQESEIIFKKYFKSPAHCILKNYPRSLQSLKPRISLTILAQCQCFGFTTYKKEKSDTECNEPMICLDDEQDDMSHTTQLPMDGTPCGDISSNNVCWNGQCVKSHH